MTTLLGSKKNLTVSIGFFVLVAAAIALSTLIRGSTVVGVVFVVIALGLIGLAVVLQRMPANELRITPDAIELARPTRAIGSISRGETGGRLEIRREIFRGRTFWSLVTPGAPPRTGISVDDFDPDEIHSAAEAHGWTVVRVE
jgi:hypothetical protein